MKKFLSRWIGNKSVEQITAKPAQDQSDSSDPLDWLPAQKAQWGNILGTAVRTAKDFATAPEAIIAMDTATTTVAMDNNLGFNSGFVGAVPESVMNWYGLSGAFPGFQTLSVMSQHWLIEKCCSLPGEDAIRHGYNISLPKYNGDTAEASHTLAKWDKKLCIKEQLAEAARFTNIFGIRVCLFVVESTDKDYYSKPFNIDGVTESSYKGISQIDPTWIMPELSQRGSSNPADQEFYEPMYWIIAGKRYHRSHLVILRGPQPPDVLKPSYLFAGISLTQRLWEHVYDAERTAAEAPRLALAKRTTSMKVDTAAVALKQGAFESRLSQWVQYRDNFGVKILGKNEELNESDTSLADVDTVIMGQYQIVASISQIPLLKLMGTSPKGFSSGGEELVNFHEFLETVQSKWYEPILDRHYVLLTKSTFGQVFEVDISWVPVASASAEKQSIINKNNALAGTALMNSGVIKSDEERDRIRSDKRSGYSLSDTPAPGLPAAAGAVAPIGASGAAPKPVSNASLATTAAATARPALHAVPKPPMRVAAPPQMQAQEQSDDADEAGAAGVVYNSGGSVLLLKRSENTANYPAHWGWPGGGMEAGETREQTASRESMEEIGHAPDKMTPLDVRNGFASFESMASSQFTPVLNDEHTDYVWATPDNMPSPLHPGVEETMAMITKPKDGTMIKPLMEKLAMALIGIIKEAELDSQMPTASKTAQQIETPGPTAGTPAKAAPEVAAKTPTETDNAQAVSPDAKGAVESRMVEGQVTRTAPAPSDPYKDQGRIDPSVKPTVDPSVDPSVKTG